MAGKIAALITQNKGVIDRVSKDFGISQIKVPKQLASKIVPVLISNPAQYVSILKTLNNAGTIYTTPTNADFYLTYVALQTSTGASIDIVINGVATNLLTIMSISTNTINFTTPIKVDRGSTIVAATAATCVSTIGGYIVEGNF